MSIRRSSAILVTALVLSWLAIAGLSSGQKPPVKPAPAAVVAIDAAPIATTSPAPVVQAPDAAPAASQPATAPASAPTAIVAPTVSSTPAGRFMDLLLQILAAALIPVAVWLAHRLIVLLEAKMGIKVSADMEGKIAGWIDAAIAYGEEAAHKAIVSGAPKLSMGAKMDAAANFALDLASKAGVGDWSKAEVVKLIEAHLGVAHADDPIPPSSPATK